MDKSGDSLVHRAFNHVTSLRAYPRDPTAPVVDSTLRTRWNHAVSTLQRVREGTPASNRRMKHLQLRWDSVVSAVAAGMGSMSVASTYEDERAVDYRAFEMTGKNGRTYRPSVMPAEEHSRAIDVFGIGTLPPPLSGSTFLYDNCLYLDQAVGTAIQIGQSVDEYFTSTIFSEGRQEASDYFGYIAQSNATIRVGSSIELPVRFPHPDFNSLRYIADTSVPRQGFGDLLDLGGTNGTSPDDLEVAIDRSSISALLLSITSDNY